MKQLNETLKEQIKQAIRAAEERSSCEFVAVITQKSGDYRIYAFFFSALVALIVPHLLLWLGDWFTIGFVFRLQIALFVILLIVTHLAKLNNWLTPGGVKKHQAALVAAESFRKFGLHRTASRRAVLFFVSIDEGYVEIIADVGIEAKIPSDTWRPVIEKLRHRLSVKNVGQGYLEAIEACGAILMREFPAVEGDVDELPNELIIDTAN